MSRTDAWVSGSTMSAASVSAATDATPNRITKRLMLGRIVLLSAEL
jgi:hypothetical protein